MGAGSIVGKSSALSAELRGLGAKTPETQVYSGVSAHQQALTLSVTLCPVLCGSVKFYAKSAVFISHTGRTTFAESIENGGRENWRYETERFRRTKGPRPQTVAMKNLGVSSGPGQ